MALTAAEQKIIETVSRLSDDMLDFTCRLVAEPSTLGNEASVVDLAASELERLGYQPVKVPIDPEKLAAHPGFAPVSWEYDDKNNVVAVRPADGQGGRSALFNGHLDVVDPEPLHLWDHDPYDPIVRDGRLFGRGAGDMKAGVSAMIHAVRAIDLAGLGLAAPVTIETVVEEECCGNGALACVDAGYDAEAVLIPEPFGPTILTSQVGVLWFKVGIRGKPVHVYEAPAGTNAVEKAFILIQALRRLEAEINQADVPQAYADLNHPLNLNIGIFDGGNWPSTVPAAAQFHGRLSFFPGTPFTQVRERILDTIARASEKDDWLSQYPPEVEFYGFRSEGHTVPRDLPAFSLLNQCHKEFHQSDAEEYVATATTDVRAFHFFGKGQATCYGPSGANYHGANEWVDIESITETAKTYALFLARWCRLAE